MLAEIKEHLADKIIPFWRSMRDEACGGYYGYMGFDGCIDKTAEKGCILNSRIIWFFANAYEILKMPELLEEARHGLEFMKTHCVDSEYGGLYWSVSYDGVPLDTTKHTYNQAFAIYALSSVYRITKETEYLKMAEELYDIIENNCRDWEGYLEAFDRKFRPVSNEKLSENGVMAERTMNTLLHVFEAYTELYRVTGRQDVKGKLEWMLELIEERVYNFRLKRQEVFFDHEYKSLIDLHSYGHDIEAAWLIDRGIEILNETVCRDRMEPITKMLTEQVYKTAFDGRSLANECENGVVDEDRVWWVQAEGVVGFINGYQKDKNKKEYLEAAARIWGFIREYVTDKREGMEWFWKVDAQGKPYQDKPIVEPWKCPYHNGRMCIEVIRRGINAT
ncbi:AGE family epimerase/isomerase [Enterocloster clostridioformis]|uniref:AGE family epimerase/isomerase n=1 Tax=Enterocloster clostridioformis TaxID=1531 RepID=UPI0026756678|nr:AGE family epimerase/isomerase [Enterocloster clostridioformis]